MNIQELHKKFFGQSGTKTIMRNCGNNCVEPEVINLNQAQVSARLINARVKIVESKETDNPKIVKKRAQSIKEYFGGITAQCLAYREAGIPITITVKVNELEYNL